LRLEWQYCEKKWLCKCTCRPREGQTIVFFAVATLVLMGMLGLALDAGYDFTQRRTMQNAADAAALYGANMVYQNVNAATVNNNARTLAIQNGLKDPATNSTSFSCRFVDNSGNDRGDCGNGYPGNGAKATGVRVSVAETHPTFVMRVLGITTSSTGATATSYAESPGFDAPIIVCGFKTGLADGQVDDDRDEGTDNKGNPNPPDQRLSILSNLDANGDLTSYPAVINQTPGPGQPMGKTFLIHSPNNNKQFSDCGYGSSFQGVRVPGNDNINFNPLTGADIDADHGNHGSNVEDWVIAASVNPCNVAQLQSSSCVLVLPIIDQSNSSGCPGAPGAFCVHMVRWAVFNVVEVPNGKGNGANGYDMLGTLMPDQVVPGIGSLNWTPGSGPAVIRLAH
jgi:Flp pilus assembly protein TadG